MIEISVLFGLYVFVSGYLIHYLITAAREERQELEDRLMVLSKPDAAILHKAQRDKEPAEVSYIDEDAEFALQAKNGRPELLGDDD